MATPILSPQESLLQRRRIRAARSGCYSPTPNAVRRQARCRAPDTLRRYARGRGSATWRCAESPAVEAAPGDPTARAGPPGTTTAVSLWFVAAFEEASTFFE